ncbi:MAG: GHKL domain-containing protein [Peptococcaceae bacterium]|nr:GHKL domain-containing protein [Peptococcaceae bacterium]
MSPHIVIVYFIADVIYMFAIERFMGVFFEKRRTSFPVMASSYLLYLVLATVNNLLFFDTSGLHRVVIPLTLFIISLNYESSVPKRLVAVVSNYALFNVLVNFAANFADLLPASWLVYVNDHFIGPYMLASLLSYLVAHLLRRFKDIRKREIPTPLFWISALAVPGTTVAMVISGLLGFEFASRISLAVFLLGVNFLVLYMHDVLSAAYEDKLKSALHSQENEYYLSQCRLMQESLEKMKSYKHDMKMHLAAIKDYTGDNKKAVEYLNSLLGSIEESEVYSDTGNIAFDSIINFKLKNAKEDNIKPEIEILVPSALNIEVADIVTILGNLLDNALDAVAKVEEKLLKLTIKFSKGNLFIKMDNTFDGEVNYTGNNKAGEEKRIATRKEGEQHGYGLKNIRKSVEKYNGCVDIAHTDTIFSVGLLLYPEKEDGVRL